MDAMTLRTAPAPVSHHTGAASAACSSSLQPVVVRPLRTLNNIHQTPHVIQPRLFDCSSPNLSGKLANQVTTTKNARRLREQAQLFSLAAALLLLFISIIIIIICNPLPSSIPLCCFVCCLSLVHSVLWVSWVACTVFLSLFSCYFHSPLLHNAAAAVTFVCLRVFFCFSLARLLIHFQVSRCSYTQLVGSVSVRACVCTVCMYVYMHKCTCFRYNRWGFWVGPSLRAAKGRTSR
jgi:hypothetical protein